MMENGLCNEELGFGGCRRRRAWDPVLERTCPSAPGVALIIRHSRTGVNNSDFLAPWKPDAELRAATRTTGGPNGGRGADLATFLGIYDALLPSAALECVTIERLTPALVVATAEFRDEPQNLLDHHWNLQPTGARRMQSGRSERQRRPASQLPHECRSAGRTMDATDTAAPETRYRRRSQVLLYNGHRPHSSLERTPDRAYFKLQSRWESVGGLDAFDGSCTNHTYARLARETRPEFRNERRPGGFKSLPCHYNPP